MPCTLVWDWPDFEALFEPELCAGRSLAGARNLLPAPIFISIAGAFGVGRSTYGFPLGGLSSAVITTCHSFGRPEDARYLDMRDLGPWLPRPSARIREKARAFREARFPSGGIVGFHISAHRQRTPLYRFARTGDLFAREVDHRGGTTDLSCHRQSSHRAADAAPLRRQHPDLPEEPRHCPALAAEPTSRKSATFRRPSPARRLRLRAGLEPSPPIPALAMALNASPRCAEIEKLPVDKLTAADRWQAFRDRLSAVPAHARLLRRRYEPRIGIGLAIGAPHGRCGADFKPDTDTFIELEQLILAEATVEQDQQEILYSFPPPSFTLGNAFGLDQLRHVAAQREIFCALEMRIGPLWRLGS